MPGRDLAGRLRASPFGVASTAMFLDGALYLAVLPLLPLYAPRLGLSKAEVGLVVSAFPVFMLLTSLTAGVAADRLGGRPLMLLGALFLPLVTLTFAFASAGWHLMAGRAIQGLASGLIDTVGTAWIASESGTERRAKRLAVAGSIAGLSTIAGPALGGAAASLGVRPTFLALTGVAVVLPPLVVSAPRGAKERLSPRPTALLLFAPLRAALPRGGVAYRLIIGMLGGATLTLLPLRLAAEGVSPSAIGALLVAGSALGLLLAPPTGGLADQRGLARVTALSGIAVLAFPLGVALPASRWLDAILLVAMLPAFQIGGFLSLALIAEWASLGSGLGAGFGLASGAWALGAAIGPVVAGAIADRTSDTVALAALVGLSGALALPLVRLKRSL